ncbi:hypothetical protein RIF29_09323 [Crotalaria pallida]|uniref:Uncharacterized protein n=1 Tax=Crotalaria pallida TaxID=3830 RepID=A0AAN9IHU2_CROPI
MRRDGTESPARPSTRDSPFPTDFLDSSSNDSTSVESPPHATLPITGSSLPFRSRSSSSFKVRDPGS